MGKRKTVDVSTLKDQINKVLKQSTCDSLVRQGMINILEQTLFDTGNYCGFRYLSDVEVETGQRPGITRPDGPDGPAVFTNTDPTRVEYF